MPMSVTVAKNPAIGLKYIFVRHALTWKWFHKAVTWQNMDIWCFASRLSMTNIDVHILVNVYNLFSVHRL
jgi:hypothetical protein